jgi:hypothetical protein
LRWFGSITAAITSATVILTRTVTVSSPNPGSSITMVPMRANTSRNAAASAGRREMSMRMGA